MSFKNEIFPKEAGFGAVGGPRVAGSIVTSAIAGEESRALLSSLPAWRFDLSRNACTETVAKQIIAFVLGVDAAYHSFRYWDPLDYTATTGQGVFTTIDATHFQMMKRYTYGSMTKDRRITKPISGSLGAFTGGSGHSVDYATGIVTVASGTPTAWTGQFHVHTRMAEWDLDYEIIDRAPAGDYLVRFPALRLVEIKAAE